MPFELNSGIAGSWVRDFGSRFEPTDLIPKRGTGVAPSSAWCFTKFASVDVLHSCVNGLRGNVHRDTDLGFTPS